MKKFAILMAVVTLISASSVTAFAAQTDITQDNDPKTSTLTLTATKDVAYTLSIPAGNATVDVTDSSAQKIGEIGLTAGNFTQGSIDVEVTSEKGWKLVNKTTEVAYTIDASENKYSFTAPAELTDVNLTVTDTAAAAIAGTYTDTLTFTATANGVQ